MEAASSRRQQVELPVLLVEAHRVAHVVGIEPQHPEPREQRAPAARKTLVVGHDCERCWKFGIKNQENNRETRRRRGRTGDGGGGLSGKCVRLEATPSDTRVPPGAREKIK